MDAMLLFSPNHGLTIGFFRYGFPLIFLLGGGYCCGYFYILNGGHYMTFDIHTVLNKPYVWSLVLLRPVYYLHTLPKSF